MSLYPITACLIRGAMQGLCALSACSEPCLLAVPAQSGSISILDLQTQGQSVVCELHQAHKSPVVTAASPAMLPELLWHCAASTLQPCVCHTQQAAVLALTSCPLWRCILSGSPKSLWSLWHPWQDYAQPEHVMMT